MTTSALYRTPLAALPVGRGIDGEVLNVELLPALGITVVAFLELADVVAPLYGGCVVDTEPLTPWPELAALIALDG